MDNFCSLVRWRRPVSARRTPERLCHSGGNDNGGAARAGPSGLVRSASVHSFMLVALPLALVSLRSHPSVQFCPVRLRPRMQRAISCCCRNHGGASGGVANAPAVLDARVMDHRTLKTRQEWTSAKDIYQQSHYQNLVHPVEQQTLPPPARITPFSGVTPQVGHLTIL